MDFSLGLFIHHSSTWLPPPCLCLGFSLSLCLPLLSVSIYLSYFPLLTANPHLFHIPPPFLQNNSKPFFKMSFFSLKPCSSPLTSPAVHFSSVQWSQRCMPISQACLTLSTVMQTCQAPPQLTLSGPLSCSKEQILTSFIEDTYHFTMKFNKPLLNTRQIIELIVMSIF